MIKRLLLSLLAIGILASAGCLFHRKARKPKESGAIANEVETEFESRWVTKRVGELTAQGMDGIAARRKAEQEYRDKYEFAVPKK